MLANIHHQIIISEVLPPPNRFWYYLSDLPFRIQNMAAYFQLELEHLISCKAPWSTILSGAVGTDIPLLRAFLKVLSGNDLEYDSNDVDYNDTSCMCYHIDDEVQPKEVSRLTPLDQSPRSHVTYL
jgi:hypothetical protein